MNFEDDINIGQILLNAQQTIAESSIISGDMNHGTAYKEHDFQQERLFPALTENQAVPDTSSGAVGLLADDLSIGYKTTATISVAGSGASYNNTLGAYTISADGTIKAVELAYTNVKDPLNADNEIAAINQKIATLDDDIAKANDQIAKWQEKIEKGKGNISNFEEKIAGYQADITQYQAEKIALTAQTTDIEAHKTFTYDVSGEQGSSIGLFIIANGDTLNKDYQGLDLQNGTLKFIYHLGQADERLAKITDTASDIALVHEYNGITTILQGDIYHTTERDGSTAINPDDASHVLAGTTDDSGETLRLGFEDLNNLGDADYNDVVIDIKIAGQTVETGSYNDILNGDAENNLFVGGLGRDIIDGKEGIDTVDYSGANGLVFVTLKDHFMSDNIDLGLSSDKVDKLYNIENIIGSAYGDRLVGDSHANTIMGGDGNDVLFGWFGDDILYGGNGDDVINGDNDVENALDGNDIIYGGAGNDRLFGWGGDDFFNGGSGNDIIYGGSGNDTIDYSDAAFAITADLNNAYVIQTNGERDTVFQIENLIGTAFGDKIIGSADDNHFSGHGGNDTIYGQAGNDTLEGGDGNDTLYGDFQTESSLDGNDVLYGGAGNDTLIGGGGDDFFNGGSGNDIIYGGSGNDTVDYTDNSTGITASLQDAYVIHGDGERDTVYDVENLYGTNYADTIVGNTAANHLTGNAGNDTLYGQAGNDTLEGGDGNDILYGDFKNSSGLDGNDTLYGGAGNDTLIGAGGNDMLAGGEGADKLYGGTGADTFVFEQNGGVDTIYDFSLADGDKLDVSSLISDFYTDPLTQAITDFVRITDISGGSKVYVDADGGGDHFVQVATIIGQTGLTDEQSLEHSGTLITL